jgi:hypothetical protein
MRLHIALLAALAALPAQSQVFKQNLIVNGDAEAGPSVASATSTTKVAVPSWTTVGRFTVGTYGKDGFLQTKDPGPVTRGKQLFYGGPGGAVSSASQVVDLSGAGTEIDAGLVQFHYSGYLGLTGGSYGNIDEINITVDFQDTSGAVLLHAIANGPSHDDADISGVGLLERSVSGSLPPKVRKAKVTIYLSTGGSGDRDSYLLDNNRSVMDDPATNPRWRRSSGERRCRDRTLPDNDPNGDDYTHSGRPNVPAGLEIGDYYKYPQVADPGPPDRGKYYSACYTYHPCQAYQTFDFSAAKSLVDAGKVSFSLSGWLGGGLSTEVNHPDNADVNVTFYDSANKPVGSSATIGPVLAKDRNGKVGLFQRAANGGPTGARRLITITFHGL